MLLLAVSKTAGRLPSGLNHNPKTAYYPAKKHVFRRKDMFFGDTMTGSTG
jgi:hypothetical protein